VKIDLAAVVYIVPDARGRGGIGDAPTERWDIGDPCVLRERRPRFFRKQPLLTVCRVEKAWNLPCDLAHSAARAADIAYL